jgi:hypothetical protein
MSNFVIDDNLNDLKDLETYTFDDYLYGNDIQATSSSQQASKQATSSSQQASKQATSSSQQATSSKVADDGRLTYEDFFNRMLLYLSNDQSVKFTSAADKKMRYTILQTLERISTDEGVLLQAYKTNEKIKVSNKMKLEENKYKLGVQKRHRNRIFSLSNPETFRDIYETTEEEVFPVYKLLWNAKEPYERNDKFIRDVKQIRSEKDNRTKVLENKTDKYLYSIYDEYENRSIEIHDMIKTGEFQLLDGKPYIYENQKLRIFQFTQDPISKSSPKAVPKPEISMEGARYNYKINAVFENMKSFILGGDDDIWREWYISHKAKEKYDALKLKWNTFVKENEFNIQIENNTIYLSVPTYKEPTKIRFTSFEKFDDQEQRYDEDIQLSQTLQKGLKTIYNDDLNMYKSYLFGKTHGNKHLLSYTSRYEIMKSDKKTIENDLTATLNDEERRLHAIGKIDFMLSFKKAKRSRSLRIVPKNKNVVATPSVSPFDTPPPNDGKRVAKRSPKKK